MPSQTDALKEDIAELRETIDKIAGDVSNVAESVAAEAMDGARRRAGKIKEGAQDVAHDAVETGRQGGEAVVDSVRQHPVSSLLIALGTGLVIGQLLRKNGTRQ